MKFERISENQIKITVPSDDLEQWGVSATSLAKNAPEAQAIFWNLIRRAEYETGFVVDESRLMVEALPQKNMGIILFMTKLTDTAEPLPPKMVRSGKQHYRVKAKEPEPQMKEYWFRFASFDDICDLAAHAAPMAKSSLYAYESVYYLSVLAAPKDMTCSALHEYGDMQPGGACTHAFFAEHGTVIAAEHALETVRQYFAK